MRFLPPFTSIAVSNTAGSPVRRPGLFAVVACGALLAGGCGVPPELRPPPGVPVPSPSVTASEPVVLPSLPTSPTSGVNSATPFPETVTASCAGRPNGDQVVALVRKNSSVLPATGTVTVVTGPLCAGSWQYTVLQMAGREPLQVVSKGAAESMTLVTAGTDICSIEVRNYAPPGIRIAARC
jgi:hypothetical protein